MGIDGKSEDVRGWRIEHDPAKPGSVVVTPPTPVQRRSGRVVAAIVGIAVVGAITTGLALSRSGGDAAPNASPSRAGSAAASSSPVVVSPAPATLTPTSLTPATTTPATTTPATTTPATTTPATTTPAAIASPPTTTAIPTTTVPATTGPPAATAGPDAGKLPLSVDQILDSFTDPVRWAVYKGGKVYLRGRVPSQAVADQARAKVVALLGDANTIVEYTVDATAPLPDDAPVYVEDTIQFASGRSTVAPQFQGLLDIGVALLATNPNVRIYVLGHTDSRGTPEENLRLSQDRVQAVVDYVAAKGADISRVVPVPRGESEPVADESTATGQQSNRRVEFIISGFLQG